MSATLAPIERSVRTARRRIFQHALINRLAACWSGGLVLGLGYFVAEPMLFDAPPANVKWFVVGGLIAVATGLAVVLARLATPAAASTALEMDTRFGLRERITTALGLTPAEHATPAGQALLADAAAKVAPLSVKEKFPVQPRWHVAFVPALAACLVLAAMFPMPNAAKLLAGETPDPEKKKADPLADQKQATKPPTPFSKQNKPPELGDRADKSRELKDLEEQMNEMMRKFDNDPNRETPEKLREKATELTNAEEKMKKFAQEKFEKLEKMQQQLQQLDRLNKDNEFQDGPAKKLNDALSKGDLKKAEEELDQLKKKLQDKTLTKEEQEKLAKQLDKMKEELKQQAKNKERQDQLKKLIDDAKKEGRDAEGLERELDKLKAEQKQGAEAAQDLAEKMQKAKDALDKGDLEEAAKQLEQAGKSLEKVEGDLQDLEDAEQYLQRLKGEKCEACKKCQGQGSEEDAGRKDYGEGQGRASGLRNENKDAKTDSKDERVKGLFDPKGKKTYGGATRGPAFSKATTAELGPAIQEAAQEAGKAADSQRVTREAKDSVREYFQNLGGQSPGGNR